MAGSLIETIEADIELLTSVGGAFGFGDSTSGVSSVDRGL